MEVNTQTLVSAAALIGAAVAIYKYFAQSVRFIDRQRQQDAEIEKLKETLSKREAACRTKIDESRSQEHAEMAQFRTEVNEELCLINYSLLACLKGLSESGCDGPVHDAIDKLEKHLNQKAHK